MPTHPWRCSKCKRLLGTVIERPARRGRRQDQQIQILQLTSIYTRTETGVASVTVYCVCGQPRAWSGGRVEWDRSDATWETAQVTTPGRG